MSIQPKINIAFAKAFVYYKNECPLEFISLSYDDKLVLKFSRNIKEWKLHATNLLSIIQEMQIIINETKEKIENFCGFVFFEKDKQNPNDYICVVKTNHIY